MTKLYTFIALLLVLVNNTTAKTYTLTSGKWTNENIWGNFYPGTTIKATDTVVITGSVVLTEAITIDGYLQVAEGANLVGSTDLVISSTGTFINDGNTVTDRIINEGTVVNNRSMDAINNIDNRGKISNGSNMAAGNDFNNSGIIEGKKSTTYFVQNSLISTPSSQFSSGQRFFCGNTYAAPADMSSIDK